MIVYRKGKENPTDGPLKKPDYNKIKKGEENPLQKLLAKRIKVVEDLHTDYIRNGSEYSTIVTVLTRSKSQVDTLKGDT
jgi:hypothetical protein